MLVSIKGEEMKRGLSLILVGVRLKLALWLLMFISATFINPFITDAKIENYYFKWDLYEVYDPDGYLNSYNLVDSNNPVIEPSNFFGSFSIDTNAVEDSVTPFTSYYHYNHDFNLKLGDTLTYSSPTSNAIISDDAPNEFSNWGLDSFSIYGGGYPSENSFPIVPSEGDYMSTGYVTTGAAFVNYEGTAFSDTSPSDILIENALDLDDFHSRLMTVESWNENLFGERGSEYRVIGGIKEMWLINQMIDFGEAQDLAFGALDLSLTIASLKLKATTAAGTAVVKEFQDLFTDAINGMETMQNDAAKMFTIHSPVDIEITDGYGNVYNKNTLSENWLYIEGDLFGDGEHADLALIYNYGEELNVNVIPEETALPDDTYSLIEYAIGSNYVDARLLQHNSLISEIVPLSIAENSLFRESSSPAVPEPTTMLLLGTGLIGLAGARRKMKR